MTARTIAEALAGRRVKQLRGGNYLVPCPAHDDSSPSLSLRDGDRGLMVHCWGGCSALDVYQALRRKGLDIERGEAEIKPTKGSSEHRRRQAEKAEWLWSKRRPIAGSIAE